MQHPASPHDRSSVRSPRVRLALAVALLAALVAAFLAQARDASAAACPAGLTVAGLALTGADCVERADGALEITTPRLLAGQVLEIRGTMILALDRGSLRQKTPGVPLVAAIRNGSASYQEFMVGTFEVGQFEFCDLFRGNFPTVGVGAFSLDDDAAPTVETADRLVVQTVFVGCRTIPSFKVTQPALRLATQLLKLKVSVDPILTVNSTNESLVLPHVFGLDEERGGRVFGNLSINVPLPTDNDVRFGLTAEFSRNEGLKPVSVALGYTGTLSVLPGVKLVSPAVLVDPANERYAGRIGMRLDVVDMDATGIELAVEKGKLQSFGFDIGLPPPGFPVTPAAVLNLQSIGLTLSRGSTSSKIPAGGILDTPVLVQGRSSFSGGPSIGLPSGPVAAVAADVDITVNGPTVSLVGIASAAGGLAELTQFRGLIGGSPFRLEAESSVAFPKFGSLVGSALWNGRVFIGLTKTAFTGLGTVVMKVPDNVPLIGGRQIAGVSGVISNKAVAGTVFVDPPLLKPRNIGLAFKFGGGFDIIDSITPFITVTPTSTLGRSLAGTRATFGAGGAGFDIAAGTSDVVAQVKGAGSKPTGVSITGPDGKKVTTFAFPSEDPTILQLGIAKPKAGRYTVTGGGIAEVTVATLDEPSYLDPRAGWGTRAQPPITVGTPVPVCWDIENAPAGAVVDLFEDTNGFAATGRDIALDLPASGCFDIPTTDWEPGKHWAYGVVRVGDTPLSMRYWPIGITVTDPNRLPAPTGLKAKPTLDGATVTFKAVTGADGYVVTAVPVDPQDAPLVKSVVNPSDKPTVELSLRGAAKWNVSVQATDDGVPGNASKTVVTGATTPVVLAGTPNGTAQVGEPWAFQLEVANLKTIRLLASPKGTKLNRRTGLLTWTPSAKAGTVEPQLLRVEGCSAGTPKRCITQEWYLSAYGAGFSPSGPARGFEVLDSVVKPGETIELRAQGIDEAVTVKVDGKRLKATILDQSTVSVVLPKGLKKGPHDVSLRIGQDLEETLRGAIVVL